MKNFIKMVLKYYYTVIVMALFILIMGLVAIFKTPIDIFPEINTPVVTAVWTYTGMPAKDIERRIVTIAERAYASSVNDIEHIESQSLLGVGVIRVFLHPGADINTGITQVSATSQVCMRTMPAGIMPPNILKYTPTTVPVLQVVISSLKLPIQKVTDLAQNNIKVQLTKVEGAQVPLPMGGKVRQIIVDLDMQKMEARGLTPADVTRAVASQNVIIPSGNTKIGGIDYLISMNNATSTVDEMNNFPITSPKTNQVVYLSDIGHIHDGNAIQTNIVRKDGIPGSLMTVYKSGKVSSLKVVEGTKKLLPVISKIIPDSVNMQILFDQSVFVKESIRDVIFSGALAALLTALMVLVFLGSVRSTLIIAISIPLSVLFAVILSSLFGQTINMMSLSGLGLAIGMLVDNATVVIENILRNKEVMKGALIEEIIYKSTSEVAVPTLVSTLSICMVFAPIFLMEGATKYLFIPLAMSVIFSMLGSYLLSNTLVPVLVDKLLRKKEVLDTNSILFKVNDFVNTNFARLRKAYKKYLVKSVLDRPKVIGIVYGLIILSALLISPLIGQNFFPEVDAGQIRLHVYAPHGTRIEETAREFKRIEDTIRKVIPENELETILDNIGLPASSLNLAFMDSSQIGVGDGEILIALKKNHKPTKKYVKKLRKRLNEEFPDSVFFFQNADMVGKILNFGLASPIDVQIQGKNIEENYKLAVRMLEDIRRIRGVADAHIHQITDAPEIQINVDKIRASMMNLSQEAVSRNVLTALTSSGQVAPNYWVDPENGVNYTLALQVPQYNVDTVKNVTDIPVAYSNKTPVRLANIASVKSGVTSSVVNHYDIMPVFDILMNIQDRDLAGVAGDVNKVVKKYQKEAPRGTFINIHGQAKSMNYVFTSLLSGLMLALILVYLLIVVNFQSWRNPFIIITPVPLALSGIIWMLFVSDTTFSVQALMGSIMAVGVSCANSILVVSFATDKMKAGYSSVRAAIQAGYTRIRPVIMTASAMILGMLPMALGIGEGGEQNVPIGRTVIGGLLFATYATLVIVPMLFAIMNKNKKFEI